MTQETNFGWSGKVAGFLDIAKDEFIDSLQAHHARYYNSTASKSQITAWENSFVVLQTTLQDIHNTIQTSDKWTLVFEYELPRERGRRPDLVILTENQILVLEFKDFPNVLEPHLDQVIAYGRDLANYHKESHGHHIECFLVITKAYGQNRETQNVRIVSPDLLYQAVRDTIRINDTEKLDPKKWIDSDYDPLPSLVTAARMIFNHEPLPSIRRAQSAGIPQTVNCLLDIADQAKENREHHLAIVTGVPGAGKTLVGLQFVYNDHFRDQSSGRTSVFLSGNGPLVQVLQHALRNTIFVQDVHGFLKQYGGSSQKKPSESIFIFDEAQRAWDIDRVREKRGSDLSEPQDFLSIGEKKEWSMMIALIGEGQEIHIGEEGGLVQWNQAINSSNSSWIVSCPSNIAGIFPSAKEIKRNEELNLSLTLRSHLASDMQFWVELLLEGKLDEVAEIARRVKDQGFNLYVTQNLETAFRYVKGRYCEEIDKRYGIIASSKAKNLPDYGIHNEFQFTQRLRVGPWYNDPPDSGDSCCQLREVATEFSCQGLELDFPIVGWGNDLLWNGSRWVAPNPGFRSKAHDPNKLRINSYRVLLTRGRDGIVVFVPRTDEMKLTYQVLRYCGLDNLL